MTNIKKKLLLAYKKEPNRYMGACVVSKKLSIPKKVYGHNYFSIHKELLELKKLRYLEQKFKKGFKLRT